MIIRIFAAAVCSFPNFFQNSVPLQKLERMNFNKFKIILWSVGILLVIFLGFFLYQMTQTESLNSMMTILMLFLGLILGGVIAFLASKKLGSEAPVITESSHTIAESMRKVFKVVSAEGHFNEI